MERDFEDPAEIVERASRGDTPAIDALLERYLPALRAFIRLRAGAEIRARESVSDLVQSVCLEALRDMGSFRYQGEVAFRKWLFTMALRKVMDRGRHLRFRREKGLLEIPASQNSNPSEESRILDCYASFCTPSADAMFRERMERIERAFDELPEEYRDVIVQSRIVGLSYAEIGTEMGRSDEAVRKLLARGLARLSRLLDARH